MLTRRALLIGTCALTLTGCGFKLKGFYEIPDALKQVVVSELNSSPTALGRELIQQLQSNGVLVTDSAPYRLELQPATYNRRAITLNAQADATEYELNGQTTFALYQGDAESPVIERRVSAFRTYADNNNTVALESLESRYRSEINQALAEQIIRQYLSAAPGQ